MEKRASFARELAAVLVEHHGMSVQAAADIQKAFIESDREAFDDFLLEEGLIEKDDLLDALSRYYQVPSFDVDGYFFSTALLHQIPKDFLLRNAIIPLEVDEMILVVIAAEPEREGLEAAIRAYVSYDIEYYVGIRLDICDAVKEYYDKSVTQVKEDEDLNEEHDEDREAYHMLEGDGDDEDGK